MESDKTYKDLINEGFEVKSYAINNIETENGFYILLLLLFFKKIMNFMNVKNTKQLIKD